MSQVQQTTQYTVSVLVSVLTCQYWRDTQLCQYWCDTQLCQYWRHTTLPKTRKIWGSRRGAEEELFWDMALSRWASSSDVSKDRDSVKESFLESLTMKRKPLRSSDTSAPCRPHQCLTFTAVNCTTLTPLLTTYYVPWPHYWQQHTTYLGIFVNGRTLTSISNFSLVSPSSAEVSTPLLGPAAVGGWCCRRPHCPTPALQEDRQTADMSATH